MMMIVKSSVQTARHGAGAGVDVEITPDIQPAHLRVVNSWAGQIDPARHGREL